MRSRRLPIGLIVPAALVLLVALLATLQYKWLGQVSDAERDRLRTSLRQNAEDFAADFDRELTRTYSQFVQSDGTALLAHDWTSFAKRYDTWREGAKDPLLVQAIYLAIDDGGQKAVFKYVPDTRSFEPASWPEALEPVRTAIAGSSRPAIPLSVNSAGGGEARGAATMTAAATAATATAGRLAIGFHEPVFPSVPALVASLPTFPVMQTVTTGGMSGVFSMPLRFNAASLVIAIDRERLRASVLPSLVARYFSHDSDQYRFAVLDNADTAHPVFARGLAAGATLDPAHADATVPLFALRSDLGSQLIVRPTPATGSPIPPSPPPARGTQNSTYTAQTLSIVVDSRSTRSDVVNFTSRPAASKAAWQLVLQHTSGSLDAAVGEARRRNLWLSFGILAVLAAGVGLIVINAERSQKLAAQQMDFVATVSHELRTPLTVIRSAAQNLSAGVVSDPAQAKRYGDLIEAEGRRLTDMVEQVLEYAGLSGNRRLALAQPIDAGAMTRDLVDSCAPLFEAERVEVQVDIADTLPPVLADEGAVRRALNNLVANALKYGADGRWIGVSVRRAGTRDDEVQISVSDKGRGIDADDLPHIFEAFYRGRYALDRQIHGNGLGLSLVKRIAEAHGGRVTVSSVPGHGATFTIHLPAAHAHRIGPDRVEVHPLVDPATESSGPAA